jgi:hypothetical protein
MSAHAMSAHAMSDDGNAALPLEWTDIFRRRLLSRRSVQRSYPRQHASRQPNPADSSSSEHIPVDREVLNAAEALGRTGGSEKILHRLGRQ